MSINLNKIEPEPEPEPEPTPSTEPTLRTWRAWVNWRTGIIAAVFGLVVVVVWINAATKPAAQTGTGAAYTPVFDCTIDAGRAGETKSVVDNIDAAWKITAGGTSFCMVDFPAGQGTMTDVQKSAMATGFPDGSDSALGPEWDLSVLYRHASDNAPDDWKLHSIMAPHEADWARGVLVLAPNHPRAAQIRAAIAQWDNHDRHLTTEQIIELWSS